MKGLTSKGATPGLWSRAPMKHIKRVFIAIAGATVLVVGIALIVLPGPAVLVIPAGVAILAVEFAWARRWIRAGRAVFPRRFKDLSMQSVRRSGGFLLRQVRRSLLPGKNHL